MLDKITGLLRIPEGATELRVAKRQQRLRAVGVGILVPTLLVFVYYALLARPEFETEMKVTVQGLEQQSPDLLTGIGLPSITQSSNDGLVIVDFIQSRELVRRLVDSYGFDLAYGQRSFDPFARVAPSAPLESKTDFWLGQSAANYDTTSNVITIAVRAFTPEESLRLAEGVLAETESVVNSLNSRVQNEAVRVAEEELAGRREEYNEARRRVIAARANRATTIEAESQQQIGLVGGIESQLAQARVERATAIAQFRPDSPQIRALDEQIASLERERDRAQAEIRGGPGIGEAQRDVSAQTALLDYEFAQQAYYAAIQARQGAVNTREGERRYLVAFVPPRLAEVSNYWGRFTNVFAVAVAAALFMAVAMLGYSVIKDHMQ
ncbi:MAG: hypothetical protein ABR601_01700 [Parasphingopyxis sp.]|nr:hypothetical protein [Sphingomonadales bacterium]